MATFAEKLTVKINDIRGGWSETYFLGPLGSIAPKAMVQQFVAKRSEVLGSGCTIVRASLGATNAPRGKLNFKFNQNGTAADLSGNAQGTKRRADQRDTCALMPYRTAAGTLRYVTLGGFPDAWIDRATDNEDFQITQVGQDSLDPFYDYVLKAPALQIRERLRLGDNAAVAVTDMHQHTDGKYLIVSPAAASLVSGDKVVLTGLKGNNLANAHGTRKVADVIDGTHFTIDRGPRADLGDVSLTVNALVSKVGYSYEPALATPEGYGASTRRRGRGFAQRRGRRSASK